MSLNEFEWFLCCLTSISFWEKLARQRKEGAGEAGITRVEVVGDTETWSK
jgi:hypothetical protein